MTVPADSNSIIRGSLESFTLDAERWLVALYWCVRTSHGDDAAQGAVECWLRVFEEELERSSGVPELTRITTAAIDLFISTAATPSAHRLSSIQLFGKDPTTTGFRCED